MLRRLACITLYFALASCSKSDHPNAPGGVTGETPSGTPPAGLELHAPGCKPWAALPEVGQGVTFTPVYAGLKGSVGEPVAMAQAPGDSNTWYLVELYGRVSSFPARDNVTAGERQTLLDLTGTVYAENEAGLLSFAIDPNFATNRQLYLSYTVASPGNANSYIWQVTRAQLGAGNTATTAKPQTVFAVPEPYNFHIGGHIAFGPDNYLYVGAGMADTGNDPTNNAQKLGNPYGKILRLNVGQNQTQTYGSYGIPASNPFVQTAGARPEIYAYGFRNPWQFGFDRATGQLWLGDVGENAWEEVDNVQAGKNYGWPDYEGTACNPNAPDNKGGTAGCDAISSAKPVLTYSHDSNATTYGSCVVSGFVYRGSAIPALVGSYIFADCLAGTIWSLQPDASGNPNKLTTLGQTDAGILSFAQDNRGEIYFVDRLGGFTRIDPPGAATNANIPQTLAATGCFDANSMTPVKGVLPYTVNVPFWSDGADKARFVSIPEGGQMTLDANDGVTLPAGTILVKNFQRNNIPVETRIYARQQDGSWSPYSYAWKNGTTTLVPAGGADVTLSDGSTWHYPSQAQCKSCHTAVSSYALGWQIGQLNAAQDFGDGKSVNQLQAYARWGLLKGSLPKNPTRFESPDDTSVALETRARTYLHVNCAICHQPGGQGLGEADYRITTPDAAMNICQVAPSYGDFGLPNPSLLSPGAPASSLISYRIHATDSARMPPVSSDVVDTQGAGVVDAWISSLKSCPQ